MAIHIREAKLQDFSAICNLIKNELGYSQLIDSEAVSRLEFFNKSDDWATFVAVVDDKIAGFIGIMKGMAYEIDGYYSKIMALAVSTNSRRIGVGTALVKKVEEWSLSHGITDIVVNSGMKRVDAHAFYEKNGYIKKSFSFAKSFEKYCDRCYVIECERN